MKAKTSKRGPFHLPEVALYRGPQTIGAVNTGSHSDLFGYNWALLWDKGRGLVLLKEVAGQWLEQTSPEPLPALQKHDRHLTAQSDQAARPVIAWERSQTLWIWFWNPFLNTFELENLGAGVDPVLMMDAQLNGITKNSDVVLFYLSLDRQTIHYRLQRDRWATPYTLATLPQPMYLDQAVALPFRYELWLGTDELASFTLRSVLYPIDVGTEFLTGTINILDGTYLPARIDASGTETLASQISPQPGVYAPAAIYTLATEALAGQVEPQSGVYALAVIRHGPATEALAGQIEPQSGVYALAVIRHGPATEALTGQIAPLNGFYGI